MAEKSESLHRPGSLWGNLKAECKNVCLLFQHYYRWITRFLPKRYRTGWRGLLLRLAVLLALVWPFYANVLRPAAMYFWFASFSPKPDHFVAKLTLKEGADDHSPLVEPEFATDFSAGREEGVTPVISGPFKDDKIKSPESLQADGLRQEQPDQPNETATNQVERDHSRPPAKAVIPKPKEKPKSRFGKPKVIVQDSPRRVVILPANSPPEQQKRKSPPVTRLLEKIFPWNWRSKKQ